MTKLKQLIGRVILGIMAVVLLLPVQVAADKTSEVTLSSETQPAEQAPLPLVENLDVSTESERPQSQTIANGVTLDAAQDLVTAKIAPAETDAAPALIESPAPPLPIATVETPPPAKPTAPLLVTSYRVDNGLVSYVQIYNSSSSLQPLDGWTINFTVHTAGADVAAQPIALSGYLPSKQYMVVARDGWVGDADQEFSVENDSAFLSITKLQFVHEAYATDARAIEFTNGARYDLSTSTAGNYTTTSKYIVTPPATALVGGGWYNYSETTNLRVVELLVNASNCVPLDDSANCYEYVKLQNQSASPIDLASYRLRLGYGNASPTIDTSIPLSGVVIPGEFVSVRARSDGKPLAITASGGSAWLEDAYGLHVYSESIQTYQDLGVSEHKGHSWALDVSDGSWKWAVPTPNGQNNFTFPVVSIQNTSTGSTLKPCADNQYRSEETNRCRLIATSSSTLTPCKEGQYRSEETNRCRSIATAAAAVLKPCDDDQFRNPATGRCKKIASTEDLPQPCPEGKERNPNTNRCRNIVSTVVPQSAFAVEPVKQGVKSFVGWWALGGISIVAAGYGAWEWRRELASAMRRIVAFTTRGKN